MHRVAKGQTGLNDFTHFTKMRERERISRLWENIAKGIKVNFNEVNQKYIGTQYLLKLIQEALWE